MTCGRWGRIAGIYARVALHSQTSRRATLDKACAGDAELRREVESLLTARDNAGNLLFVESSAISDRGLVETNVAGGRTFATRLDDPNPKTRPRER
jgi:hypothetical protein